MNEFDVKCQTGLSGAVRKILGKDLPILGNAALIKKGEVADKLIAACWVRTDDPGPYEVDPKTGKLDWAKVLQGDRSAILMQIAIATYGPRFEFDWACAMAGCRKTNHDSIDLATEPDVKPLSDDARTGIERGNVFDGTLPDGVEFTYRLPIGADERLVAKIDPNDAGKLVVQVLAARMKSIGDVTDSNKFHKILAETYSKPELEEIGETMSEHDFGIQTRMSYTCGHCSEEQMIEVPFFLAIFQQRKRSAAK